MRQADFKTTDTKKIPVAQKVQRAVFFVDIKPHAEAAADTLGQHAVRGEPLRRAYFDRRVPWIVIDPLPNDPVTVGRLFQCDEHGNVLAGERCERRADEASELREDETKTRAGDDVHRS